MFQWMPGTRRAAAAAESASGSSTWAKTRRRGSGACRPRRSTGRSWSGSSGTRRPPFSPDGPRHPGPAAPGTRPAGGGPYDARGSRESGGSKVYGKAPENASQAILARRFLSTTAATPAKAPIGAKSVYPPSNGRRALNNAPNTAPAMAATAATATAPHARAICCAPSSRLTRSRRLASSSNSFWLCSSECDAIARSSSSEEVLGCSSGRSRSWRRRIIHALLPDGGSNLE